MDCKLFRCIGFQTHEKYLNEQEPGTCAKKWPGKLATYYDVLFYPELLKATKYISTLFISKSEYR